MTNTAWTRGMGVSLAVALLGVALAGCELDSSSADAADGATSDAAVSDAPGADGTAEALAPQCEAYVQCCVQLAAATGRGQDPEASCREGVFNDYGNDDAQCADALATCQADLARIRP